MPHWAQNRRRSIRSPSSLRFHSDMWVSLYHGAGNVFGEMAVAMEEYV